METLIIKSPIRNFKNIDKNRYDRVEIYTEYINSFLYLDELDISEIKIQGLLNEKHIDSLQDCKNISRLVLVKTSLPNLNFIKQMDKLNQLIITLCNIGDISNIQNLPSLKELTLSMSTGIDISPIYNLDLTKLSIVSIEHDIKLILNNMQNLQSFTSSKTIKIKQLESIYNENLKSIRNRGLSDDIKKNMIKILSSFPSLEKLGAYNLIQYGTYYQDCLRAAKLNIVDKLMKEVD